MVVFTQPQVLTPVLDPTTLKSLEDHPYLDNSRMRVRLRKASPLTRRRIIREALETREQLGTDEDGSLAVDHAFVVSQFLGVTAVRIR